VEKGFFQRLGRLCQHQAGNALGVVEQFLLESALPVEELPPLRSGLTSVEFENISKVPAVVLFASRCFQESGLIVGVTRFALLTSRCLIGVIVSVGSSGWAIEPGDILRSVGQ
jgi:hypothetical protein